MSSTKNEEIDQAEELRQLIDQVEKQPKETVGQGSGKEEENSYDEDRRDVDILNLPPRRDIHDFKKTKTRLKISNPVLRLLFVLIMIIGVIVGAIYLFGYNILDVSNIFTIITE